MGERTRDLYTQIRRATPAELISVVRRAVRDGPPSTEQLGRNGSLSWESCKLICVLREIEYRLAEVAQREARV